MSNATDSHSDIAAKLLDIISNEILGPETMVDQETDLFESGLDSMAIMQLLIRIETAFGVRLSVSQVTRANFSNIEKIALLIANAPAATEQ
jgi:acyl carrier protein